eukprot:COSAG01_NODE_1152_length_11492_cov_12.314842_15_plen_243_part_00
MGLIIVQNWLRFPYDSTFLQSHYLHPHPYLVSSGGLSVLCLTEGRAPPCGRRRVHLVGVCGGALVVEQMARSQPRRIISAVVAGLDLLPTYAAAASAASSSSAEDSSTAPSPPPAVPDATDTAGWAAAREALPGRYRPAADDDGQWASGPLTLLVGAESTSAAAAAPHGAARRHAQRLAGVVAAWSVGNGGRVVAARLPLGAEGAADDGDDDGSAEEAAIAQLAAVDVTALLLGTGSSDGGL